MGEAGRSIGNVGGLQDLGWEKLRDGGSPPTQKETGDVDGQWRGGLEERAEGKS